MLKNPVITIHCTDLLLPLVSHMALVCLNNCVTDNITNNRQWKLAEAYLQSLLSAGANVY